MLPQLWYQKVQKGSLLVNLKRFHDCGTKKCKKTFNNKAFTRLQSFFDYCHYEIIFKNKNA